MKDQLPFVQFLMPVIGFLITMIAIKAERGLVRPLALSNLFCSLILFAAIFWLHQGERRDDIETRRILTAEAQASGAGKNLSEVVNSQLARRHVERLRYRWLVMDGINLWPIFLLIVISGIVGWQTEVTSGDQSWFFPLLLLFEAASLAALMSYDLRVYVAASGTSVLVLGLMLGLWGGPTRRELTVRFLVAQFCGGACVVLGFAMLVVAVPWMKIEDAPSIPAISWNITKIIYEIQKWTSGNPLSFQYQNEVFPWILLVLSLGFAIQAGAFPFHSWLIELLSRVPGTIALLFVSGLLSIYGTGWLRFVMPLSPELMAAFDWLILIPALGSAIWGSVRALTPAAPRQRLAYLFLSLSGVSLLGCFSFSRVALSGMWLMQQQLIVTFCAAVTVLTSCRLLQTNHAERFADPRSFECRPTVRSLLMMTCLPLLGFFASSFLIFNELLRESLLLVLCMLVIAGLIISSTKSLLIGYANENASNELPGDPRRRISGPALVLLMFAVVANVLPQQILASFEPEFLRVFQKFEPPAEVETTVKPSSDSRK